MLSLLLNLGLHGTGTVGQIKKNEMKIREFASMLECMGVTNGWKVMVS